MSGAGLYARLRGRLAGRERPLRFLLAGGVNTLVGLSMYPALLWTWPYLYRHYLVGLTIAQVVCTLFSFSLYKLTVFRTSGNILREFCLFSSFYYVVYVVNMLVLPVIVRNIIFNPIIAQFGFVIVSVVSSYFWHSYMTFRKQAGA